MFTRQQRDFIRAEERMFRSVRGADRAPKAALLLAVLSTASMGCALEPQAGDGLVADGWEVRIDPVTRPDAGRPDAGVGASSQDCKQLALFEQSVMPLLVKKYEALPVPNTPPAEPQGCVNCHDGTKPKAFVALAMDAKDAPFTCLTAITLGTKMEDDTVPQILTSSDPARPDKVHDFKFKNLDDHTRFRDAVVAWLNAEKQ
jgi:hypothetical protein